MTKATVTRWGVSAALAVGFLAEGSPAQQGVTAPLEISVRDIYTRDRYLEGARVEITDLLNGTKVVTVTGPDGRVTVPVVPGRHRIAISLAGYGSLVASSFCVVRGTSPRFDAGLGPERAGQRPGPPRPDPSITITPRSVPSQAVLSDAEVQDAMAFGRRSTKLSGYQLTAKRGLERWQLGHLFTPVLRVATMTQVADATKKPFEIREIPRQFIERFAWVVAGQSDHIQLWRSEDEPAERYFVPPDAVVIRPKSSREEDIRPAWTMRLNTECDAEIYEKLFGRRFPLHGLVAAFPMEAIAPGNTIVVTYSSTADHPRRMSMKVKPVVRRLTIRDDDVRSWK